MDHCTSRGVIWIQIELDQAFWKFCHLLLRIWTYLKNDLASSSFLLKTTLLHWSKLCLGTDQHMGTNKNLDKSNSSLIFGSKNQISNTNQHILPKISLFRCWMWQTLVRFRRLQFMTHLCINLKGKTLFWIPMLYCLINYNKNPG